jgi:hypothetical protein
MSRSWCAPRAWGGEAMVRCAELADFGRVPLRWSLARTRAVMRTTAGRWGRKGNLLAQSP